MLAQTISFRRRIGDRAMELVNGHESFLGLSNRGAVSILNVSFKFGRRRYLVSGETWSVVRIEQRAFGGILCLLHSNWSLRCASVKMHRRKGFAFAVREGCRELASEVGRVSERTGFKRRSKSIRARSHALRFIALDVALDISGSGEDAVSLSQKRESRRLP